MRRIEAAVALITRDEGGRRQWLFQWNYELQCYDLIGGPRLADESFRDALLREVAESLGLRRDKDYLASGGPHAHLEYIARSQSDQQETQYLIELFDVQLFGRTARGTIDADSRNRWLTDEDIRRQTSDDGQPISETATRLFTQADLLAD